MIIRRKRNSAFTVLPNRIALDPRLTIGARWLMFYLLTKPDDWDIHIADIQKVGGVGRDKAYGIVKECIEAGYITRRKHADGATSYEVYDTPPDPENPEQAGPHPENPDLGKPDPDSQDGTKNRESPRTETTRPQPRDLDLLENKLRKAAGSALDPAATGLMVLSEPIRWLDGGCDIDLDVVPTVKARTEGRKPGTIRAWGFFAEAVFEARDRRLAPAPEPRQPAAAEPRRGDPYRSRVNEDEMLAAVRALDRGGGQA